MTPDLEALARHLRTVPPGPVADQNALVALLAPAWTDIHGSTNAAMQAHKVHRIEEVTWEPPLLRFQIERHGGTVVGSTRASLQVWSVDTRIWKASHIVRSSRQVTWPSAKIAVQPLVHEVLKLIVEHAVDHRLKWRGAHDVTVNVGVLIPAVGPGQTTAGRRKRFRVALERELEVVGWKEKSPNRYVRGLQIES